MDPILDAPVQQRQPTNYAGFWIRLVAYLIDGVLLFIFQVIVSYLLMGQFDLFNRSIPVTILSYLVPVLYFTVMESSERQATVGKMALKLKVGDFRGDRISYANALGRYFAKIPSALLLGIGFMMVGWDSKKQGLHDKMADTFVFEGN